MSNVDDAHQLKYLATLQALGVPAQAVGFRRAHYYRSAPSEEGPATLSELRNERHLGRVRPYLRSLPRLHRELREASAVLAFSGELVLLARLATLGRGIAIVREMADLPRACDAAGLRGWVARLLERCALQTSAGVVCTSERFGPYIADRLSYSGAVVLLLNKPLLPEGALPIGEVRVPRADGSLRILYPGLLRCEATVTVLRALVDIAPGAIVEIRGFAMSSLREPTNPTGIVWGGPYRNPEDLTSIYSACDVVYSGYPYEPGRANYSRARTNRFFEAVHFGRPQIAHVGTADADEVARNQLGIVIDPSDPRGAASAIAEVTHEEWRRFASNAARYGQLLPPFVDDARSALRTLSATVLNA